MTCGSIRLTVCTVRAVLTLLSSAAALTLLASAAQADCPTNETARKGFTMKTDQNLVWEVTGYDGDLTNIVETIPSRSGGPDMVTRYALHRGLVTILGVRPDFTMITTFEPSLQSFFPLTVGKRATFKTVRRVEAKPDVIARLKTKPVVAGTMDMRVVGKEAVRIGGCSYETILVERELNLEGEPRHWIRPYYSPDLSVTLTFRFIRENPGKEPTPSTLQFTSIASK